MGYHGAIRWWQWVWLMQDLWFWKSRGCYACANVIFESLEFVVLLVIVTLSSKKSNHTWERFHKLEGIPWLCAKSLRYSTADLPREKKNSRQCGRRSEANAKQIQRSTCHHEFGLCWLFLPKRCHNRCGIVLCKPLSIKRHVAATWLRRRTIK